MLYIFAFQLIQSLSLALIINERHLVPPGGLLAAFEHQGSTGLRPGSDSTQAASVGFGLVVQHANSEVFQCLARTRVGRIPCCSIIHARHRGWKTAG